MLPPVPAFVVAKITFELLNRVSAVLDTTHTMTDALQLYQQQRPASSLVHRHEILFLDDFVHQDANVSVTASSRVVTRRTGHFALLLVGQGHSLGSHQIRPSRFPRTDPHCTARRQSSASRRDHADRVSTVAWPGRLTSRFFVFMSCGFRRL